jgi:septation ring formation regulator EzrA
MPAATNELIFEVLKKVQEDVSQTRQDMRHVREELIATRGHLLALQKDANNIYERLTTLENKVDRIERRLELSDTPA